MCVGVVVCGGGRVGGVVCVCGCVCVPTRITVTPGSLAAILPSRLLLPGCQLTAHVLCLACSVPPQRSSQELPQGDLKAFLRRPNEVCSLLFKNHDLK